MGTWGMFTQGVTALQTVEQDGMVFVWTGQGEHSVPTIAVPDLAPPKGYTIHSEITLEVRALYTQTRVPSTPGQLRRRSGSPSIR
jgi:phenylpropionate dioxygenase-like ring-hydroxylating dioxygenase large terminal subunit